MIEPDQPNLRYRRSMLSIGDRAPDFTLPNQDGNSVSLDSLLGNPVVIYFYPRADTPGCTKQACGIRDHSLNYSQASATVVGISPDPVDRVKHFHEKFQLNFNLLADEDHSVCERYDVWAKKSIFGKSYWGAKRSTFILDDRGVITWLRHKVDPRSHAEDVLSVLASPS